MWTAEQIEAEDMEALSALTEPQKRALERAVLARNMANFTAATMSERLQQQYQIEANLRNAAEREQRSARPALRLVGRDE